MIIREFKVEDRKGIMKVLQEVWKITKIEDSVLDEWMKNNHNLVAVEGEEVIGTITLHTQRKLIRDGGISGFIEDLAVKEKYRGNKVGSMLVKAALRKAKEIGCYKVILTCFDERISFYEREGFFKESNTMRINLD